MTTTSSVAREGLFMALDKVPAMVDEVHAVHPRFAEPVRAMLQEDPAARPTAKQARLLLEGGGGGGGGGTLRP